MESSITYLCLEGGGECSGTCSISLYISLSNAYFAIDYTTLALEDRSDDYLCLVVFISLDVDASWFVRSSRDFCGDRIMHRSLMMLGIALLQSASYITWYSCKMMLI